MGKKMGSVYVVKRRNKTNPMHVGEFKTHDDAIAAMINHYQTTPKRGKFYYTITLEELEEIGGVVMRMYAIVLNTSGERTYWEYTRQQIEELSVQEGGK